MNKPTCVVAGAVDTYSGYGQRTRDFVKALYELKKDEWDIKVMSLRWGSTPWGYLEDNKKDWEWLQPLCFLGPKLPFQPDYFIQITVPNEFNPVGKYFNVGVTAGVETTLCDSSLIEGVNRMNLTLTSSEFGKSTLMNTVYKDQNTGQELRVNKPVEVLFEGVDISKYFYLDPKIVPKTDLVKDLDSIKEEYAFLFVGHWLAGELGQDRKNVGLMIQSFLSTFKNIKNKPALVLKTSLGGSSILDKEEIENRINRIRQSVGGGDLPNIYLLHGELEDKDLNLLYNHPKIKSMVSLTKGEGFGRPLLEFTQAKKPIAVSAWSGHLDFLSDTETYLIGGQIGPVHESAVMKGLLIKEAQWFYPDPIEIGKMWLSMYKNHKNLLPLAEKQYKRCKTEFSLNKMKDRLGALIETYFLKVSPLKMPQLKRI